MSRCHHLHSVGLGLFMATFAAIPASLAQPAYQRLSPDWCTAPALTKQELDAFADLVKEPHDFVAGRLRSNPDWLPMAGVAAEARMHRLGRGKAMANIAVPALVIGGAMLIWGAILAANWDSSHCSQDDESGCDWGAHLMPAGLGGITLAGGLVVGAISLYDLTRLSDAEFRALDRYAPGTVVRPPPARTPNSDSFARLGGARGRAFSVPLVAVRF